MSQGLEYGPSVTWCPGAQWHYPAPASAWSTTSVRSARQNSGSSVSSPNRVGLILVKGLLAEKARGEASGSSEASAVGRELRPDGQETSDGFGRSVDALGRPTHRASSGPSDDESRRDKQSDAPERIVRISASFCGGRSRSTTFGAGSRPGATCTPPTGGDGCCESKPSVARECLCTARRLRGDS